MKALIVAAFLLWALPAAAQTNPPEVPIPAEENHFLRQLRTDEFLRDRRLSDLSAQQAIAALQDRIDSLRYNVKPADLNPFQQALDDFQNDEDLQRLAAERRIFQIEQQGDTARRRRWAARFSREQAGARIIQRQRLADIEQGLSRFSGR